MKLTEVQTKVYNFVAAKPDKTATRKEIQEKLGFKFSSQAYPLVKKGVFKKFKTAEKKVAFQLTNTVAKSENEPEVTVSQPTDDKIEQLAKQEFKKEEKLQK